MKLFEKSIKQVGVAAAAALLSFGLGAPEAEACGGFFCNNTQPTVQTGERILFTVDDENIRAYVQVYYDGPADDFAWIVPVATVPDVGVGTDQVFTSLDQLTSPRFQLEYNIDESCQEQGMYFYGDEMLAEAGFDNDGGDEGGGGEYVNVLAAGKAGPYNYEVVESNNSDLLVAWLNENDYEQPPEALPLIDHYVAKEMKFVAVKLQPGKDTGDIAPIILDFQEQSPCVPLVLTSIAATEDMPVKAFVLGKERAVPTNWMHVTVNEKKIDWFAMANNWWWGGGFNDLDSSYENVLIEAIDEAEGHAFTTEFAGSSEIMKNVLDNGQYDNVSDLQAYENPTEFVMAIQSFFSGSNQLMNILLKHIPVPEGYSAQDFYNWPEDYQAEYDALDIDLDALYNELIDVIVTPVKEAQEMFDKFPYLTRLYSRVPLSAMDRDPIFDFQDAGDVSNIHKATLHMTCTTEGQSFYMELENGETFVPTTVPNWWDIDAAENLYGTGEEGSTDDLPAAERIELFAPGIAPRVVAEDDASYVEEQLKIKPAEKVEVPEAEIEPLSDEMDRVVGGTGERGCSSSNGPNTLGWMSMLMVGLACLRRREMSRR